MGALYPWSEEEIFIVTGGLGGGGAVAWGPDFGESSDDNTFTVGCALTLGDIAPTFDLTVGAALALDISSFFDNNVAGDFTELRFDADYVAGANAAVNDGPDSWTSVGNTTGLRDGTEASRSGQALSATDANARLTYADPSGGIELFTITQVQLRYDTRQTGTVLNNGGLYHEYRIGAAGAWTTLEIFTGNIDNDPIVYDITAAIAGSWTNINDLQVRVRAVLAMGTAPVTCFCDAVELRIVANRVIISP